jgi:hypothetical protein
MALMTETLTSFQDEITAQWRLALAAIKEAEAAGDAWLAELFTGRLDDLCELVRVHGLGDAVAATSCAAATA